jgi:hypothetical protein
MGDPRRRKDALLAKIRGGVFLLEIALTFKLVNVNMARSNPRRHVERKRE